MTHSIIRHLARRHGRKIDALTRREMLKATLAASAGMLISTSPVSALIRLGRDSRKRIVVIGGGFAGLACAHELTAAGHEVTVLEARARVGGRVLSFNKANGNEFIKGRNIEGGAELIGSNHPAWVNYKEHFKLEFIDVTDDEGEAVFPIVIDDRLLDFHESEQLWTGMEAGLNRMNELARGVPEDEPWTAPDAGQLDRTSIAQWVASLDLPQLVKKAMLINQVSDNGQAAARQSLLGQLAAVKGGGLEKFWTDSEVYRCDGGNDQLARRLSEAIGADRVLMQSPARAVRLKGNALTVELADGRTLDCEDVVLAVPPPLWSKIECSPALPADMTPQTGLNTKYLAHVKERFWQKGAPQRSQYALSDGLIQQTWDATDGQREVEDAQGGACLTGFSGGPVVEKALAMSKEDRDRAFGDLYEQLYPQFKSNLSEVRYMDWPRDPLTASSYSFPAPGEVTTVGPLMAKSHMDGRLHIAGEHTCYKFVGYMEGALSSGVRVARRIAERDGALKPR